MKALKTTITLVALLMISSVMAQPKLTLKVDKAEKEVSPTLYGLMTEEINYSYEGGLYAQLIGNSSFKEDRNGTRPAWGRWKPGGPKYWNVTDTINSHISLAMNDGINRANPVSLCFEAKVGSTLTNDGFWGIPVKPNEHFEGAFFAKGNSDAPMSVIVV